MESSSERIARICESVSAWLANEDGMCRSSIQRTVDEGLFPGHDVAHMVEQAGETVTPQALSAWMERATGDIHRTDSDENCRTSPGENRRTDPDENCRTSSDENHRTDPDDIRRTSPGKILCLHAGNLPMVGFQDVIATLLSGAVYYGKLSRKDPWLLDGFLRILQKRMPGQVAQWSVHMDSLQGIRAGKVLFAGSQASVEKVMQRMDDLDLAAPNARFLSRTARLSMAWLTQEDFDDNGTNHNMYRDLAEAMLRYDGKGCRSVAVVIAPRELSRCACPLMNAARNFLRDHPPAHTEKPGVRYWKNYLKTIGKEVYDFGGQIITSDTDLMGKEDVICWMKGVDEPTGRKEVERLAGQFGPQLQSVYVTDRHFSKIREHAADDRTEFPDNQKNTAEEPEEFPDNQNNATENRESTRENRSSTPETPRPGPEEVALSETIRLEPLSRAQAPPIDWRPDGTDVLHWIVKE